MARVLIVGAGVVGSATGKGLAQLGHNVVFSDTNPTRLDDLSKLGYATWPAPEPFEPDLIFVCVGTPTVEGQADLSQLQPACSALGPVLQRSLSFPVVVVRSTVPPGTMKTKVVPWLEEASGRRAEIDFGVCFSPEFLRRASAEADFLTPWAVVIGVEGSKSAAPLLDCLRPVLERCGVQARVTDFATAELTKYAANLFNATKISFANQIWLAGEALGVDGNEVMKLTSTAAEGMWNPSYGTRGGAPFGGDCLPKDLEAFLGLASAAGFPALLLDAVAQLNASMPAAG